MPRSAKERRTRRTQQIAHGLRVEVEVEVLRHAALLDGVVESERAEERLEAFRLELEIAAAVTLENRKRTRMGCVTLLEGGQEKKVNIDKERNKELFAPEKKSVAGARGKRERVGIEAKEGRVGAVAWVQQKIASVCLAALNHEK